MGRVRPLLMAGGVGALLAAAGSVQGQTRGAGFWLMGLSAETKNGQVRGLSHDGRMAAGGNAGPFGAPGYTWTQSRGRVDFGLLPSMPLVCGAYGLSDNGVVAGTMGLGINSRAYRWTGSGPLQNLGLPPGTSRSWATGVSGDGSVVVGYGESGSMGGFSGQAFRWTPDKGMQALGFLKPMSIRSQANGVSRDGTTIVGRNMDFNLTDEAIVWTEAGGMKALPNLPGALISAEARGVNADGSVFVGNALSSAGFSHAVRWTNVGVQDMVDGPYRNVHSTAYATSDDGQVVGGWILPELPGIAFVWTPATGMIDASDYFASYGLSVPIDYTLTYVYAISGDGLTFGGSARNLLTNQTEGWVATVPAANSCKPDCDENGQLNIDDFICFQTFFALGEPKADCDGSGRLNIDDFICFQTYFAIGC